MQQPIVEGRSIMYTCHGVYKFFKVSDVKYVKDYKNSRCQDVKMSRFQEVWRAFRSGRCCCSMARLTSHEAKKRVSGKGKRLGEMP